MKAVNLSTGSSNEGQITVKYGAPSKGWIAKITAYSPDEKFDLEREFLNGEATGGKQRDFATELFEEGAVYEYSTSNYQNRAEIRGFFTIKNGELVHIEDKNEAIKLIGAERDEGKEIEKKISSLEKRISDIYTRNTNEFDSGIDDMSLSDLATVERLERELEDLKAKTTFN